MKRIPVLMTLAAVAGCGDSGAGPDLARNGIFPGTVSDAGTGVEIAAAAGAVDAVGAMLPMAWISLPPGTVPEGRSADIENERTGQRIAVTLRDGGFDPVPVPAVEGDVIGIAIAATGGMSYAKAVVPARRRPRVVRTDPPRGRLDVAVNSSIVVIFSEPIADSAVARVRLVRPPLNTSGVPATISRLPNGTGVQIRPEEPLHPGWPYRILLESGIVDLAGDSLDGGTSIYDFSTSISLSPSPAPGESPIAPQPGAAGPLQVTTAGVLPAEFMAGLTSDPIVVLVTNTSTTYASETLRTRHRDCIFWLDMQCSIADPASASLVVTEDYCDGRALAPLQSCTVKVAFAPRGIFYYYSAIVFDEAERVGYFVTALAGTGLVASPHTYRFPIVDVGDSTTGYVLVANRGDRTSGPVAVVLGPGPFAVVADRDRCTGRQLAPGSTCSFVIRYRPESPGEHSADLHLLAQPGGPYLGGVTGRTP